MQFKAGIIQRLRLSVIGQTETHIALLTGHIFLWTKMRESRDRKAVHEDCMNQMI